MQHPELERHERVTENEPQPNPTLPDPDADPVALKLPGADKARAYRDILQQTLIDPDPPHHRDVIVRLHEEKIPILTASIHLFAPVANRLGDMWCEDEMDFVPVAVASSRLNTIVNNLVRLNQTKMPGMPAGRRVVLARTRDENHTLGLTIVAACFADSGWVVDGGPDMIADDSLMQQLKSRSYDLMGLSVGARVPSAICKQIIMRGIQNSENRQLRSAIGGPAIVADENAFRDVGADIIAKSAIEAVGKANELFA